MKSIKVVIMAGGVGERFWPKSRQAFPKQFLKLKGNETMIQQTVNRLLKIVDIDDIYIATGQRYESLILKQLTNLPQSNIIIEPCGRNTAPCIGLAAAYLEKHALGCTMVVLPSDHVIENEDEFCNIILKAAAQAEESKGLVTLGIKPTHPDVGYGYIKYGQEATSSIYTVDKFVEKPNEILAKQYLDEGNYLWNSGMFIWKSSVILNEFKKHMPSHYDIIQEIAQHFDQSEYKAKLNELYPTMKSESIDFGIMEYAENIYVIPCEFGWDDVGSWNAIERLNALDASGNFISGNVITLDSKNCTIDANEKLIATIGVENLIVVDTDDALLLCTKSESHKIKELLKEIKAYNNNLV